MPLGPGIFNGKYMQWGITINLARVGRPKMAWYKESKFATSNFLHFVL